MFLFLSLKFLNINRIEICSCNAHCSATDSISDNYFIHFTTKFSKYDSKEINLSALPNSCSDPIQNMADIAVLHLTGDQIKGLVFCYKYLHAQKQVDCSAGGSPVVPSLSLGWTEDPMFVCS